ncbi:MAG TPA: peptide-methionine (R)-S-oxide reductase MsrB [Hyphomicrobiaceae bacterium]|nr:peptide-methionine (R)-S-oxide reductase MsrB [Hyphomicrobiaceae bacterium]
MITRRTFGLTSAAALLAGWGIFRTSTTAESAKKTVFEVMKTDAEWRKSLSPQQYYVLRKHGTERPFTSPLDKIYNEGTFHCAGCDLPLYSSKAKYDSRTGWPSFWKPLDNAVGMTTDYLIGYPRTEVHCKRCGGHLGHVFDDGPQPTGKRYCMNGVAMKFVPKTSS